MKTRKENSELWVQETIRGMLWKECGVRTDKIPGSTLLKGHPDLLCGCPELGMFYIEVKAPGKKLRWSQVEWAERWDSCARIYVVDHPEKLWTTVLGQPPRGHAATELRLAPNRWRWAVPKGKRIAEAVQEWAAA